MTGIRDFLRAGFVRPDKQRGTNFIVVRHSPDWLSFDPESSRAFCVKRNFSETLIIDFMAIWDAAVAVDYRQFRFRIKEIAQQTLASVEHAQVISDADLCALALAGKVPPDALVAFVDDDDWFAPHLFTRLREFFALCAVVDGFLWGSVRLGRDLKLRPIDQRTFTNNYAGSGAALRRLGIAAICEHFDAHAQFDAGRFAPATVAEYLSCTNKHPACTMRAYRLLDSEEFRRDPRADIRRWAEDVTAVQLPVDLAWIQAPRDQLVALLADAARC